jgi:hypothetical protein
MSAGRLKTCGYSVGRYSGAFAQEESFQGIVVALGHEGCSWYRA